MAYKTRIFFHFLQDNSYTIWTELRIYYFNILFIFICKLQNNIKRIKYEILHVKMFVLPGPRPLFTQSDFFFFQILTYTIKK